ncbi:hypothetical protein J3B02_001543 [Coemansia erecta]|nr:hypothetical protein J3B02_001543 [Coemansia erecta]
MLEQREWTDWQFTREDLRQTPSVHCGWTVEREELDRAKACSLIYSASRKLQLPQITSASACVYLHRFFMRHSLKEYHHYSEETLRKLDSFIPVIVYYASKGNRKAPPGTSEFEKWRMVILHTEVILLEALCFDMIVDHPYVFLIEALEKIRPTQQLSQMSWNFIADFLRLPLCLVYPPRAIAMAAISLATKVASFDMRKGLEDGLWMDRVGADNDSVSEIVQWLLDFYTREAQSRSVSHSNADSAGNEVVQTPASSPGSATSPMSSTIVAHQSSPSSEPK